jgi:hypothetical protein
MFVFVCLFFPEKYVVSNQSSSSGSNNLSTEESTSGLPSFTQAPVIVQATYTNYT